jgi:hypothetical protein
MGGFGINQIVEILSAFYVKISENSINLKSRFEGRKT